MSFRPRFRLSLLFVLAALVAGVSVWLRQAVVRDRNIRELLAEEWVHAYADQFFAHEATSLNTRILNYFSSDAKYRDHIQHVAILLNKVDKKTSWQKYHDADLGESLGSIVFLPDMLSSGEQGTFKLSQLAFWLSKFRKIDSLSIGYVAFVNDAHKDLRVEIISDYKFVACDIDTTTLKKLIGRSKNIDITYNRIRGKLLDLRDLNLPVKNQEILGQTNTFTEDTP